MMTPDARGVRHRRQNGGRSGDARSRAIVHDDERQKAIKVAGLQTRARRQRQRRHYQPVGKPFRR